MAKDLLTPSGSGGKSEKDQRKYIKENVRFRSM